MHNYTGFGTKIRVALARKGWSVGSLCRMVSEKTGKYFDESYLSKICRGVNSSQTMIDAIKDILDIKEGKI